MGSPGEIVGPAALWVGDLVQARDRPGLWYNAKVIGKSGRGSSVAVKIRYVGFSARWDAKFTAGMRGLRWRLPVAALKAERDAHLCYWLPTTRRTTGVTGVKIGSS